MSNIFYDDGSGTTERTLDWVIDFLKNHRGYFKPRFACIENDPAITYNLRIEGDFRTLVTDDKGERTQTEPIQVLLSGCSCGYIGEGTSGTLAVLNYLVDKNFNHRNVGRDYYMNEYPEFREIVFQANHVHFNFDNAVLDFYVPESMHVPEPRDLDMSDLK
jgi:hypothetical protein